VTRPDLLEGGLAHGFITDLPAQSLMNA